ncbi:MAG: hypothetical protein HY974_00145 [Candidatus Kerfeldbacteria bacterium]|nr:hypothetical protein [Candidatus Kerfeldbacteria bacterium]
MTQYHVPYDPDFDGSATPPQLGGTWSGVSPKLAFLFGLAVGVAAVALFGLLVMWRWW